LTATAVSDIGAGGLTVSVALDWAPLRAAVSVTRTRWVTGLVATCTLALD
jgi:hypothetical protein